MDTLGIDVAATDSDNLKTFRRMNNATGAFTYDEIVVWFRVLSKRGKCQGLAECAEEYAQRLVADEERNQGWSWLDEPQEFWSFMKTMHYRVLEKYGFDRGLVQLPLVGTPNAHVPANVSLVTPGVSSNENTFTPTPPVAPGASGVAAAMEGFAMRRPHQSHTTQAVSSVVTGVTEASAITQAIVAGMTNFTEQMKEDRKSQLSLTDAEKFDKPVPGIMTLEPDMGYKIKVSAFLAWLKSIEEAWGKVSAQGQQLIAKMRRNLRLDESDLRQMLSENLNQRLYISLIDKVGGTIKGTVQGPLYGPLIRMMVLDICLLF